MDSLQHGDQPDYEARRRVHTDAPALDRKRIYADMAKLFLSVIQPPD